MKVAYYFIFFFIYIPFKNVTGVEIHPLSNIGKGLYIPHCNSIVISKKAIIGNNLTIHQFCTIGVNYNTNKAPQIGNGVFISCNTSIIGDICVRDNTSILPNSYVSKSFEEGCLLGGVPAKIIKKMR
ncbi:hypothetical protein IUJ58_06225 [Priestia aryabhattai]|uniref:serine O-acetyltransferase n=1 Tax=Priestia aryabhattai TaxID=412384 RepID=UPI002379737D|nr:hypothetical protein [Priestia aryabhattai]WDL88472.1 hypothetical protein IUJ58_06225 [Priestia aryabhattai]